MCVKEAKWQKCDMASRVRGHKSREKTYQMLTKYKISYILLPYPL